MPAFDPDAAFGVYVHWPFCLSKCPYCDFNSHVRDSVDQERWAQALALEIDSFAADLPGRTVTSIFFGGGTPSLMAPETVDAVIQAIGRNWAVASDVEVTAEANPTSAEAAKFEAFAAAGVNRLSLGVQALDAAALKFLGREHSLDEALDALAMARDNFVRVSFDLIYARPGQSLAAWEAELGRAIELGGDHLSLYQLTMEPGTAFYTAWRQGELKALDDDAAADFFVRTQQICEEAGLPAYEVSNHARRGEESRHNLTYWHYGEYLGIGPGAHGRLRLDGTVHAVQQRRKPETWLSLVESTGRGTEQADRLEPLERATEFLLMGLRTRDGVALDRLEAIAGIERDRIVDGDAVERLVEGGLIESTEKRLSVRPRGFPVLNAVIADLLLG